MTQTGMSPLMIAAQTSSLEAVNWLLDKGADPNLVDNKKLTALCHAILAENIPIIKKLLKITSMMLGKSLEMLAESTMKIGPEIISIIKLILNSRPDKVPSFLESSTIFGKHECTEMLFKEYFDLVKEHHFGKKG